MGHGAASRAERARPGGSARAEGAEARGSGRPPRAKSAGSERAEEAREQLKMPKISAGLLMYRRREALELFIVHPGGPLYRNRDDGAWSIPKGEVESGGDPLQTARREFSEETGLPAPEDGFTPLGEVRQKGGKLVVAWAFEGDCDPSEIESNSFEMEWPPRSGTMKSFPEVDRAAFVSPDVARMKLNPAQSELVSRLQDSLSRSDR